MVKDISPMQQVLSLLISLLIVSSFSLHAQEKDVTTWTSVGFKYQSESAFAVTGGLEWRTKDDLSKTDRWGVDIGVKYDLFSFLELGMGYEMHYLNREEDGWKIRHRYHVDGTLSMRIWKMKFSLRERFQQTEAELRLRSRLKMVYDIPKCKLKPYVAVEMYNGLNGGEHFDVKRMRYRGGVTLLLSEQWEMDVFYCRQWENTRQKNIIGIECNYVF